MAKLKKMPKNFRLAFESAAFLEAIAKKKDVTETQVLEISIAALAAQELSAEEREEILVKKFREMISLDEKE